MEHFFQNIQNWFTFPDIYRYMVKTYPDGSHFVEVGAWLGCSTAFMAVEIINSGKNIKFDTVDTWEGNVEHKDLEVVKEHRLYDEFLKNIEPVKHIVNPVRTESTKAATLYEDNSLDFVFIDGSHEYEDVLADLQAWFPKVKKGGHFAGHDFPWKNVKRAVEEFFSDKGKFYGHDQDTQGIWSYFVDEKDLEERDVTIIIPSCNFPLLQDCVASIIKYTDFSKISAEFLIVANGLPEEARAWLDGLNPNFRYIWLTYKTGSCKSTNLGARTVHSKFIGRMDDDNEITPPTSDSNWIECLIAPLRDENVGLVSPVIFNYKNEWIDRGPTIQCFLFATRKEIWDKVGGFDEVFDPGSCEGTDFSFKVSELGYRISLPKNDLLPEWLPEKGLYEGIFPIYHKSVMSYGDDRKEKSRLEKIDLLHKRWGNIPKLESFINKIQWRHPLIDGWSVHQKPTELLKLTDFLKGSNIKKVLEIGSADGGTAIYWANMMGDDGIVYTADILSAYKCYKGTAFEKQIIEMTGDTHDPSFKEKILNTVGKVDMLFIDGDHSYEGVKDDFYSFFSSVREGGFIVLHDIVDSEYHRDNGCFVATFWNEIKDIYKTLEIIDPTVYPEVMTPILSMGIGVVCV